MIPGRVGLVAETALALSPWQVSGWQEIVGDMISLWEFQLKPSPGLPCPGLLLSVELLYLRAGKGLKASDLCFHSTGVETEA